MNKKSHAVNIIISFMLAIICLIPSLFRCAYYDIDNFLISILESSIYSSNNYSFFVSPICCWSCKAISAFLPNADSFMIFVKLIYFIMLWWANFFILNYIKNIYKKILLWSMTLMVIVVIMPLSSNFTFFTTFPVIVGMLTLLYAFSNDMNKAQIIMGTFVFILGSLIRLKISYVCCAFIMLGLATGIMTNKKNRLQFFKRALIIGVCVVVSVISINTLTKAVSHLDKNNAAREYQSSRVLLTDYPNKEYDEIKNELQDVSENDYEVIVHHAMLFDTELTNSDKMKHIYDVASYKGASEPVSFKNIYLSTILKWPIVLVLLLLLICVVVLIKNKYVKLSALATIILYCAFVFYLYYIGRPQYRIILAVECIAIFYLVSLLLNFSENIEKSRIYKISMVCMLLVVTFINLLYGKAFITKTASNPHIQLYSQAKSNVDESFIEPLCIDDNLYYFDLFCGFQYDYAKQGKLPTRKFIDRFVPICGWMYGNDYMRDRFDRIGITNPAKDMAFNNNRFIILKDNNKIDNIINYLKEHYNPNVSAEYIGEMDSKTLWKIVK